MRTAVAASLLVLALAVPHAARAHEASCGGTAPTETTCSTGTHGGAFRRHGVAPGIGFTGEVESRIEHARGARVLRCTFAGGVAVSCLGTGSYPAAGETFTHTCASYVATTSPGGVGTWRCFVEDG